MKTNELRIGVIAFVIAGVIVISLSDVANRSASAGQGKGGEVIAKPTPATKKPATRKSTPARNANKPAPANSKTTTPSKPAGKSTSPAEVAFWNLIKDSAKPDDFRSYLNAYPTGQFVDLANERIKTLEAEAAKAEAAKKEEEKLKEEEAKKEEARRTEEAKAEAEAKKREALSKEIDLRAAVKANPNDAFAHKGLADFLASQKRWAEAEAAYREALRVGLSDPRIFTDTFVESLVKVLGEQKKYTEADIELRANIQRKPNDGTRHTKLGLFLQRQKRWADAETATREALRLMPSAFHVRILTGVLIVQKKYIEAESEWKAYLNKKKPEGGPYPDLAEAYYDFGFFLTRQGRHGEAEAAYRDAIRLFPADITYRLYLGSALSKQAKLAEAEAVFREVMRSEPANTGVIGWLVLHVLIKQGKYSEAEAEWKAHVQKKPDDYYRRWNLGYFFFNQKRWAEAEAEFREAFRLLQSESTVEWLAKALGKQNKWAEAENVFRQWINANPKDDQRQRALGNFFLAQKKWTEAEAAYRESTRLNPDYPLNHSSLAESLAKQRKWKEAEAAYGEAIKTPQTSLRPDFQRLLGKLFGEQNRWAEAEKAFREAIRLAYEEFESNNNSRYHNDLAFALQRQNKPSEAVGEFKKAEESARSTLQADPDYPHGLNQLGLSLEGQNKLAEAEAAYKEAVRLEPENEDYQKNLQRVSEALKNKNKKASVGRSDALASNSLRRAL